MSHFDDELQIQHALPARAMSPWVERTARLAIQDAFKKLFETKSLEQMVKVDLCNLRTPWDKDKPALSAEEISELEREIARRPWQIKPRHQADDDSTAGVVGVEACPAVETSIADMPLQLFAPDVDLICRRCKQTTKFEALDCSAECKIAGAPYPRLKKDFRQQIYLLFYRCASCRDYVYSILVGRSRLAVHLSGSAPKLEIANPLVVGGTLQQIANDAHNANLRGDLFAAFYHLRTLIEHFIKRRVSIAFTEKRRGEDLVAQYAKTVPGEWKKSVSTLGRALDQLSDLLHSRTGDSSEYDRLATFVGEHILIVQFLELYSKKPKEWRDNCNQELQKAIDAATEKSEPSPPNNLQRWEDQWPPLESETHKAMYEAYMHLGRALLPSEAVRYQKDPQFKETLEKEIQDAKAKNQSNAELPKKKWKPGDKLPPFKPGTAKVISEMHTYMNRILLSRELVEYQNNPEFKARLDKEIEEAKALKKQMEPPNS